MSDAAAKIRSRTEQLGRRLRYHGSRRPILVTGPHRSGTTWTGRMLALADGVRFLWEPFNFRRHPASPFPHHYFHVGPHNESEHARYRRYMDAWLHLTPSGMWHEWRGTQGAAGDARSWARKQASRLLRPRPLLKDPMALFSAEWLAQQYNTQNVVLIRNPAAFVASVKVKGWRFHLELFRQQRALHDMLPDDLRALIDHHIDSGPVELLDNAIAEWNVFAWRIDAYRRAYPDWYFVRHEDLSQSPVEQFRKMYDFLELEFTDEIEAGILSSTTTPKATRIRRDTEKNLRSWKERLSADEVARIKAGTARWWPLFYDESYWE